MAGASQKKIVARNKQILNSVHVISLICNALSLLAIFYFQRPNNYYPYLIFNGILLGFEYVLEKNGRREKGRTVEDLNAAGLTEYMFDIFYLTCFLDLLMVVFGTNKVWLAMLVVPAFASYKGFWIVQMLFGFLKSRRNNKQPSDDSSEPDEAASQKVKARRRRKN